MVIRIPDFMFAQSTGTAGAPGELDYGTRSALADARSSEQEIGSLSRGLTLVGEAMKGGEKAKKQLASARDALGRHGDSGALRWLLDHASAEQARQETAASHRTAMRTLIGTIKGVGTLPIPFADRAELGRTLLQEGVARELVAPELHKEFEAAVISQFGLAEAQSAIAKATEPGEALAILADAKAEGLLQPMDSDLLDRQAKERDAMASARHRTRLTIKEQDDLAAFARGELPESLSKSSFTLLHGEKGAAAYARYQAARMEGEAIALVRGKDTDAIKAARDRWKGERTVFDAALKKDALDRQRGPADYALATVPGAKAARDETRKEARGALLWSVQAAAGIPEAQRSPWTLAEEEAMAREWADLPAGFAGRSDKLAYFRKHLLSLPRAQRQSGIVRMVQQGIADGTEAELTALIAQLDAGRFNPGRKLAATLTSWQRGASGSRANPPRSQQTQGDEQRSGDDADAEPNSDFSDGSQDSLATDSFANRPDVPGDPWPAGPETEATWRAAEPLPNGKPRDAKDQQQIAELISDLAEGDSAYATGRASRELAIYFEQAPEYRDWLTSLGEVAKSGLPLTVKGVPIDDRGATALLRQQSSAIAQGRDPRVFDDAEVLKTWNDLWELVADGRNANYSMSADLLQHYLEGSGESYGPSLSRLLSNSHFQAEIEGLQGHFANWILGDQKTNTASEEVASRLYDPSRAAFALEEGGSITVASEWNKVLAYSWSDWLGMGANQLGVVGGAFDEEMDLWASFGEAQLSGVGSITFRRVGDAIFFEGNVTYSLPDRYDFNEGDSFTMMVGGKLHDHSSEEINALQAPYGASPFDVAVPQWSQTLRGRIEILPHGRAGMRPQLVDVQWDQAEQVPPNSVTK
jgi:hypothetical protein